MGHLDIFSLYNLIRAHSVYKDLAEAYFGQILSQILARSLPRDIQELVCVLLSVQNSAPIQDNDVLRVLNDISFNKRTALFEFQKSPKDIVKCLHNLTRTFIAVQFFTDLFPSVYAARSSEFERRQMRKVEKHRLQRALWRFEVCCALVRARAPLSASVPLSEDAIDAIQVGQDTRIISLKIFLEPFLPWELEELAAVYDFLELAVWQYSRTKKPRMAVTHSETAAARYYAACRIGTFAFEPLDLISIPASAYQTQRDLVGSGRYPKEAICIRSIFPSDQEMSPFERSTRCTAVRARILSHGLIFLRAFQQQSLCARECTEERLVSLRSSMGDEFIHAALYSLKEGRNYFAPERELITKARPRPWDSLSDNKNGYDMDTKAALVPNERWIPFVRGRYRNWFPGGQYPPQAKFRSWGMAIWSYPLLCKQVRDRSLHYLCSCHLCDDDRWDLSDDNR